MRLIPSIRKHPRAFRILAAWSALTFLADVVHPTMAWALTSGPAQPEFTSFEPVVTTNMVNEASGDFTYNLPVLQVPGANGGGYALSLSYHSGSSPEDEASWVGYGWTLNPGSIVRQMRGIPDDWNGVNVTQFHKSIDSKTVTVGGNLGPEIVSVDVPLTADANIHFNNYKGWGTSVGAGVIFCQGLVTLGYHVTDGHGSFSLQVNPSALLHRLDDKTRKDAKENRKTQRTSTDDCARETASAALHEMAHPEGHSGLNFNSARTGLKALGGLLNGYGMSAITAEAFPMVAGPASGQCLTVSVGGNATVLPIDAGLHAGMFGRFATQHSTSFSDNPSYGYLYSANATSPSAAMDYHVDGDTPFNKRDKFLQMPVSDADVFTATGDGIMGTFRLYAPTPGQFRPPEVSSSTDMESYSVDFDLGVYLGVSPTIGTGSQSLEMGEWSGGSSANRPIWGSYNAPQKYQMRMTSDRGGAQSYTTSDAPQYADISLSGPWGFRSATATFANNETQPNTNYIRPSASTAVSYHTNGEMGHPGLSHEQRRLEDIVSNPLYHRSSALPADGIGEISVLNGNGQRMNYGLPVYAYGDRYESFSVGGGTSVPAHHKQWTTSSDPTGNAMHKGRVVAQDAKYATEFLLTSILDPDYVDRTGNGPSADDFGGYTMFTYGKEQADHRWRSPYNGYSYTNPELSECYDDMISYSGGYKEVYYLKKVTTKTHEAIFTTAPRKDGISAEDFITAGSHGNSFSPPDQNDTHAPRKLRSIELFAIHYGPDNITILPYDGPAIKTIRFQYDCDGLPQGTPAGAWPGVPNTTDQAQGKLLLTKVWFEYNGVVPAKIAPYEFLYKYPTAPYPSPYAGLTMSSALDEEPAYTRTCTDPWSSYAHSLTNEALLDNMHPSTAQLPPANFDPGAWQLKQITMPSGGRIDVQYEQDDYRYVQNDVAEMLVPLRYDPDDPITKYGRQNHFSLDLSSTGLLGGDFDVASIVDQIKHTYIDNDRKIFFKILYNLSDGDVPDLEQHTRKHEYISGYTNLDDVHVGLLPNTIDLILAQSDYSLPYQVCDELFKTEKKGKHLENGCEAGDFTDQMVSSGGDDVLGMAQSLIDYLIPDFNGCATIAPQHSYFRIPVGAKKLGGGLRVHRLIMTDPAAVTQGYPHVFGKEYIYQTLDEHGHSISSGVASNEPGAMRDENVLVRPLDRLSQSWIDKIISGNDRHQSEGPLGASFYPSPSVTYSRVIVKDIHDGRTAPAFTVSDYHTYKDFPIRVESTEMNQNTDEAYYVTGIIDYMAHSFWASQGYTVHLNEMNGKPASVRTYAGDDRSFYRSGPQPSALLLSAEETDYFPEGPVPTPGNGSTDIGKDVDLAIETRRTVDFMEDAAFVTDDGAGVLLIPLFSMSMVITSSTTVTEMASHCNVKVVNHPSFVKRTRTIKDGIYHVEENLAFDPLSGDPVITRSNDGFYTGAMDQVASASDGIYTKVVTKASSQYPNMGQYAKGERKQIGPSDPNILMRIHGNQITFSAIGGSSAVCDALKCMCEGDLVRLRYNGSDHYFHMDHLDGNVATVTPTTVPPGSAYTGSDVTVTEWEILKSGCDNKLSAEAGSYTCYGDNIPHLVDQPQILARKHLVDMMNQVAMSNGAVQLDIDPILSTLMFEMASGSCAPLSSILFDHAGATLRIRTPGQDRKCGDEFTPLGEPLDPVHPFMFDEETAQILFVSKTFPCGGLPVECVHFCNDQFKKILVDKVVAASATTYSDRWLNNELGNDPFETAERGRWRPMGTNVYSTALQPGTTNHDRGWFQLTQFDWKHPGQNDRNKWIMTDSITKYSPDGNAIEQIDALGHFSSAHFGYSGVLPFFIAQNSKANESWFESFEKEYNGHFEGGIPLAAGASINVNIAHAGTRCLEVAQAGEAYRCPFSLSRNVRVQAWVRTQQNATGKYVVPADVSCTIQGVGQQGLRPIANVEGWTLFANTFAYAGTLPISSFCAIHIDPGTGNTSWLDDVRVQPLDAQATAYVYDPNTYRLVATFDDQHFGLYYQYNAEGKLVRKIAETERGRKTLSETQYHTPALTDHP